MVHSYSACCSMIKLLLNVNIVLRLFACPCPFRTSAEVSITLLEMLVDIDVDNDREILITKRELSSAIDTDATGVDMELSLKELGSVRELVVLGCSGKSSFDRCLCCLFCVTESGNGVDFKVPVFCHLFTFCDSKGLNSHSRLQADDVEAFAFTKIFFQAFSLNSWKSQSPHF